MNNKASVSKELNDKHAKILEGLLKLPENRECADCKSKAPRWASINLGIFICMQCSGMHRSLGVHISKVRSTTLDTWLPEQVVFMKSTGNKKSNDYWEAELPPQFDRTRIDKFIRDKYVQKKWASKVSMQPSASVIEDSDTSRREIPKKARKYSFDERSPNRNMTSQVLPKTHSRAGSLDFMGGISPFMENRISTENRLSSKSVDAGTDLFRLLYISEEKPDHTIVSPSRWATFE